MSQQPPTQPFILLNGCAELFGAMFDGAAIGMAAVSLDGRWLRVNEMLAAILNSTREAIEGKPVEAFVLADDLPSYRERIKVLTCAAAPATAELRFVRAGGGVVWSALKATAYRDSSGALCLFNYVIEDVTERRADAERTRYLATIVEYSEDAIIGKSLDGEVLSWNLGAERIYGYTAAEMIGHHLHVLAPAERRGEIDAILGRIRAGSRVEQYDTVRCRKDGQRIHVALTISPVRDASGRVVGASTVARDISAHKLAEQERLRTAELLETVFASVFVLIAYMDREFNFIKVNRAYAAADNRDPEFFVGKNHFDLYPSEAKEIFRRVVETGQPYTAIERPFEYPEHPERGVTYWDWLLQPVFGPEHRVAGLVFSLLNVTDKVMARRKAEQAAAYTRRLIDASLDPLVTIGPDGRITDVNAATESITGCGKEELIGSDFSDYFTEPQRARSGYEQVFREGYVRDYALEIRRREGSTTPVLYNATIYRDERGQVAGVFAAARDIAARKRAEEALRMSESRYRNLFERISDGYALHEIVTNERGEAIDYVFLDANPAFERLTGLKRKNIIGRSAREVLPDLEHTWLQTYAQVARTGEGMRFREFTRALNMYFEVLAFSAAPGQFATLFTDVTDRIRAEQSLRQLNQELEQRVAERTAALESANKELESFGYSISHDLRTPLRAIDGFSRILLTDYQDILDDEGKRLLGIVRENTDRMGRLISDILALSRSGRVEMAAAEVDMAALANAAWGELVQHEKGRDLELVVGALPPARGDRVLLRQVWLNLLDNAIKFSRPRDRARVEVGAERAEGESLYFVRDNGVGFDMQYCGKLFGVFARLHRPEEFEGTGIGLAIVKRIVNRHGGRVWATSELNKGAVFYFSLPRAEEANG